MGGICNNGSVGDVEEQGDNTEAAAAAAAEAEAEAVTAGVAEEAAAARCV